ncbi:MAG: hypothetical protein R6V19_17165 [Armatimonadota bacterium]
MIFFILASDYTNAQVERGNDAEIDVVDPLMSEKGSTAGPGEVDQIGASYGTVDGDSDDQWDGLNLYAYQSGDPGGCWRAIFCAEDKGGIHSPPMAHPRPPADADGES